MLVIFHSGHGPTPPCTALPGRPPDGGPGCRGRGGGPGISHVPGYGVWGAGSRPWPEIKPTHDPCAFGERAPWACCLALLLRHGAGGTACLRSDGRSQGPALLVGCFALAVLCAFCARRPPPATTATAAHGEWKQEKRGGRCRARRPPGPGKGKATLSTDRVGRAAAHAQREATWWRLRPRPGRTGDTLRRMAAVR